ncbi:MAG TPA: L-threonylcarbamoyladenylate synthase [Gemmatimonadaceae bacterium]|nr:L-threonylcarbamoyladenylate synthase [Gemmatimonadaceae bacterium]
MSTNTHVRTIPFWSPEEIESSLTATITHLQAHRVLAYPTETVYGFGGGVDHKSVDALLALKHRPAGKPFLLLIAGTKMLTRLDLHLTPQASRLAARFWPGPLTLVLPGGERRVPEPLRGPEGGIAVRWTSHTGLLRLIQAYGDPITSTSANHPGVPPAMSALSVANDWHRDITTGVLRVLDGGTLAPSPPSTVVDCMGPRPRIIRPGAIPVTTLREAVPDLLGTPDP